MKMISFFLYIEEEEEEDEEDEEEERSSGREMYRNVNSSATNLTWTGLALSPCLGNERPDINRLSRGTVQRYSYFTLNSKLCTEIFMTVGDFSWYEGTEVFEV
jgi:hypothetical protein